MTLDESGANTAKDQQEQNTCRLLYISAVQTYASIQKNLTDHHHRPYMLVNHNHSYNYACVRTESIPYFHTTKSTTDAVGTPSLSHQPDDITAQLRRYKAQLTGWWDSFS